MGGCQEPNIGVHIGGGRPGRGSYLNTGAHMLFPMASCRLPGTNAHPDGTLLPSSSLPASPRANGPDVSIIFQAFPRSKRALNA
jgi:hypothetical protein